MKKSLVIFVLAMLVATVAQAFTVPAEVQVAPRAVTTHSYNPATGEEASFLKNLKTQTYQLKKETNKLSAQAKADAKERTEALKSVAEANNNLAEAKKLSAEANGQLVKTIGVFDSKLNSVGQDVKSSVDGMGTGMWLLAALVLICAAALGYALWWFSRRSQDRARVMDYENASNIHNMNGRSEETLELLRVVNSKMDLVDTKVDGLPAKVAEAVNKIDSAPFEFEAAGHIVSYQSPAEGISEGYYLTLHVPEGSKKSVATYDRQHETNRGIANRSIRKTMQKYLEGKFPSTVTPATATASATDYTLQRELIESLIKSGDIKVRKIN